MTTRLILMAFYLVLTLFPLCGQAQSAIELINLAAADLKDGSIGILDERSKKQLSEGDLDKSLLALGEIQEIVGPEDLLVGNTWQASGRAVHNNGISDWRLVYSGDSHKIVFAELSITPIGAEIQERPDGGNRGAALAPSKVSASLAPCASFPQLCVKAATNANQRQVEFLFATTRALDVARTRTSFTGERGPLAYGAARVNVPLDHRVGHIELPLKYALWGYDLYEQKADPNKHFFIKEVCKLTAKEWTQLLQAKGDNEALVFVHGYNNSFEDSLYSMAQIVWDLQYRGTAVLFTWASRGKTVDYQYDKESAAISSQEFTDLLRNLTNQGIKKIHVLAHSMGNMVIIDALKSQKQDPVPLKIAELIMAAPDVDRDYFRQNAPAIRPLTKGMTLYASSSDRALLASRKLAGNIPRAGDVPAEGPLVIDGIDTIDVTAVGTELLGLNHDVFASSRPIMSDIGILLSTDPRKPPNQRLASYIFAVPGNAKTPLYWRYGK
ncbi:alpha/beta fold hydrolase [Pseudoduganella sp. FT55W]|uniref:Alpha/beta fold hydrolase n=1 Tax=Duganella rivi TaxID=2666083 RepID=A0A7X4GRH3_9BURK|nr:alpha/beta fold hydrolase [Duganella rivi]MYM68355.1 alpha/beta fold hydrolase [Duganella rivi]